MKKLPSQVKKQPPEMGSASQRFRWEISFLRPSSPAGLGVEGSTCCIYCTIAHSAAEHQPQPLCSVTKPAETQGKPKAAQALPSANLANATPGDDLDPVPPSTHSSNLELKSPFLKSQSCRTSGSRFQTLMGILRIPEFAAPKTQFDQSAVRADSY